MNIAKIKFVFIAVTIFILLSSLVFAAQIEDDLDVFRYIDLQISAAITNVNILGWLPDDKEIKRDLSQQAVDDLAKIKNYLDGFQCAEKLNKLKDKQGELVNKLQTIYNGMEEKESKEVKQGFSSFGKLYARYKKTFRKLQKEYQQVGELPDGFNPVNEVIKYAQDEKDGRLYLDALGHIKEGNYEQASGLLGDLQTKYADSVFGDCLGLRLSDVLVITADDIEPVTGKIADKEQDNQEPNQEFVKLLTEIIDSDRYSPVLFEAFYKWRTILQQLHYGISNTAEIPNKVYNEKRWKLVQTVRKHLLDAPDDIWAKQQLRQLMNLPNMRRGGQMGNDNLVHWGVLYTNAAVKAKVESEEKKESEDRQ